jgi:hypothetical protein
MQQQSTQPGRDPGPGVVLVPTEGPWRPGQGEPTIRLGQAADGSPVATVFSSPQALADAIGQVPWIAVQRDDLVRALRPLGVERLLIDGLAVAADG